MLEAIAVPLQRSTPELIADAIRSAVFRGELTSGTPLKQNDLARQFKVSAAPVREAFQMLVSEGLAVFHRNRGVVVAPLDVADITDIADLRVLLEGEAIRKSAPHLTVADLDRAEELLREADAAPDRATHAELHWRFHQFLYSKAQRPRLLRHIEHLFVNMNRYVMPTWDAVWLSAHWEKSHSDIVAALRDGNADEAARLITEQIHDAAARVIEQLQAQSQQRQDDGSH